MGENDFHKIKTYALKYLTELSAKGLYILLLLYFAYNAEDAPGWAKKIIIGSIAYFVSPIDSIPDLTPFLGLTDDIGVLTFGLVTIACYITTDVRSKAEHKLTQLLDREIDSSIIQEVNSWL